MEGPTARSRRGARGYLRRRGYERLGSSPTRFKKAGRVELGLAQKPRSKQVARKPTATRFFLWFRDSYVRMMLALADFQLSGCRCSSGGARIGGVFERAQIKEYKKQAIMETHGQLRITPRPKPVRYGAEERLRPKRTGALLSMLKEEADEYRLDELDAIGKIEVHGGKHQKEISSIQFLGPDELRDLRPLIVI